MRVMRLGLFGINTGVNTDPDRMIAAAQAAESAGFESVWTAEHVVLPDPQAPPSPMAPQDPILDPLVALTWAAANTQTIRLATGIIILPQRNPVVFAKEVASVDVLSRGRFALGVGVGYLQPEFRAIGANFDDRGAVTDEFLDAMESLWYDDAPGFRGRFAGFGGIDAHPRPVQRPIPIVIGGRTPPAYRRAVRRGHGWYGFALTPELTAESLTGLRDAAGRVERPESLGDLEITVTPRGRLTADTAKQFADLGVHRLVVLSRPDADGVQRAIDAATEAVSRL